MCGRYSIAIEPTEIEKRFRAKFEEPFVKRYNAAPSQKLPVILNEKPGAIVLATWGIVPPWLAKIKKRSGLINVRAETLRDKRTFRDDLLNRRCLVVADGFYEWKEGASGRKTPYRIRAKDSSPMAFAGLWEVNPDKAKHPQTTFAIITTEANALMAPIHHRMPVILAPEEKDAWLSEKEPLPVLLAELKPAEAEKLEAYEVSRVVNNAKIDRPEVVKRIQK